MDSGPHNDNHTQQPSKESVVANNGTPSNEADLADTASAQAPNGQSAQLQSQSPSHSPRAGHSLRAFRPLLPLRTKPVSPQASDAERHEGKPLLLVVSTLVLSVMLSLIITLPLLPAQVDVTPGRPVLQDVISPASFSYQSKVLTDRAREQASKAVNEAWVPDTNLIQSQRTMLLSVLSAVQDARFNQQLDMAGKRQRLTSMTEVKLTQDQADTLLLMSESKYTSWRDNAVIQTFDTIMRDRKLASIDDVHEVRKDLPSLLPATSAEEQSAAIAFVAPFLSKNGSVNDEQTQALREQAAAQIKPVIQTVQKGEAILRRGDLATPEAVEKMQEAGLLSRNLSPQMLIGTAGIVSLLMILLHLYIYRYVPQVWKRERQLLLVAILLVFTVGVARFLLPGHTLLPYLLPLAAISMLIAVLLNTNLAVLVTFVLAMLLGIIMGNVLSMEMPIYYFVGGLAGIFTLTKVERVGTFARAGFYIGVASFMAGFMLRVLTGGALDWPSVGQLAVAATVNGVFATSITFAAFSLLGTLFGITTPLQLMELAHPDQPLLRRLMREAPGTYHHSLVVSNLAEHAAEMIEADPLLTRVCAYYHDIGKVERPYYFIDNQLGLSNVHDELNPWESAAIIAQHVSDGVRLGRKENIPRRVLDAIPQHHGTMLIKFFYYKALEQDPNANPDDFRYPGPKPHTKENAILMLADGVEAAVRSMAQSGELDKLALQASMGDLANRDASESPMLYNDASSMTEDAIASVVHKIISERIDDGQLDECDLTVRDIAHIQEAFVSMLKGIYHPRVPYPELPKTDADVSTAQEPVPLSRQRTRRTTRQKEKQA